MSWMAQTALSGAQRRYPDRPLSPLCYNPEWQLFVVDAILSPPWIRRAGMEGGGGHLNHAGRADHRTWRLTWSLDGCWHLYPPPTPKPPRTCPHAPPQAILQLRVFWSLVSLSLFSSLLFAQSLRSSLCTWGCFCLCVPALKPKTETEDSPASRTQSCVRFSPRLSRSPC